MVSETVHTIRLKGIRNCLRRNFLNDINTSARPPPTGDIGVQCTRNNKKNFLKKRLQNVLLPGCSIIFRAI